MNELITPNLTVCLFNPTGPIQSSQSCLLNKKLTSPHLIFNNIESNRSNLVLLLLPVLA